MHDAAGMLRHRPSRTLRIRWVGVTVCVAGLALVGCTDGGTPPDRSSPVADAPASPLAEFLGVDPTNLESDQEPTEADRQLHYQAEEHVRDCMAEHGFDYHPQPFWGDVADPSGALAEDADPWRLQHDDPEAFARQYGYGISTIDQSADDADAPEDSASDPNVEYQQSLSPAAREQYEVALWGDEETAERLAGDPEDGMAVFSAGGCRAEATDEVYRVEERLAEAEHFQGLHSDLAALEQRIADDSRLQAAKQAWSGCMADVGYPGLRELGDGQVLVGERLAELYRSDHTPSIEDPEPTAAPPDQPFEPEPGDLAELREFELAIAPADLACRNEHRVDAIEREVRFELEERFIEDHRELLEAYRDWMNEGR